MSHRIPGRLLLLLAAGTAALLAACAGMRRHLASTDTRPVDAAGTPLRLFLTGSAGGYLTPCGCESGQFGGISRRATYLKRVRRPSDLALDLGNLASIGSPSWHSTVEWSLEGLRTLCYDALVPGEGELRLAAEFEAAVARHPGVPVLCANLRRDDGSRVFEPWLLHALPDGRNVAVIGVSEPFPDVPAGWRFDAPRDAVLALLPQLAGKADAVIVAGALRDDAAKALAAALPGVALVAGGWTTVGSDGLVRTAGAPAVLVGEFAWYVGTVDFDAKLVARSAGKSWIDAGLPDDPDAAIVVTRAAAQASEAGPVYAERVQGALRAAGYAGSAACADCHAAATAAWAKSGHAHAMQTLVDKQAERDPQCVVCHLQDVHPLEGPTTVVPPETNDLGIGCEACHGGAAQHVSRAREGARGVAIALAPATREACLRCHVPPNATHFNFAKDWPKIAHGR